MNLFRLTHRSLHILIHLYYPLITKSFHHSMWRGLFSQPSISTLFLRLQKPNFFIRAYSKPTPAEEAFQKKIREADIEKAKNAPMWVKRDQSLRKRYGAWSPTRKLSRQQIIDIRDLKKRVPSIKTIQIANFFQVNPESIRRILKSSWAPTEEELIEIEQRAEKRKAQSRERRKAELGSEHSSVVQVKSLVSTRRREQQQGARKIEERKKEKKRGGQDKRRHTLFSVGDIID